LWRGERKLKREEIGLSAPDTHLTHAWMDGWMDGLLLLFEPLNVLSRWWQSDDGWTDSGPSVRTHPNCLPLLG